MTRESLRGRSPEKNAENAKVTRRTGTNVDAS